MNTPLQPAVFQEEHRSYLNDLRESGDINMFGARPYLMDEFPDLSKTEAASVLTHWIKTFGSTT